jgi:hypothetical protein
MHHSVVTTHLTWEKVLLLEINKQHKSWTNRFAALKNLDNDGSGALLLLLLLLLF